MMYDFSNMGSNAFEVMVRSLFEKLSGIRCQQFGMGPDGQREWLYEGEFGLFQEIYKGRTIGQVKYKYNQTKESDYSWLKRNLEAELEEFRNKEKEYVPDNYIFCTNIVLTPVKDTGIRDRINKFASGYKSLIPNIIILGYDEICALLDNSRDVAISYYGHILPGDILSEMLNKLHKNYMPVITRFLARQIEEDMYTRMEQAGSVTEKKVSIEKVCVDISVTDESGNSFKLVKYVIDKANSIVGYKKKGDAKDSTIDIDENIVIVGGPGKGKSTICQFIAQIYRANFISMYGYKNASIDNFVDTVRENSIYKINCCRIPFIVVLKEYAAWIRKRDDSQNKSLIQYISDKIQSIEGTSIPINEIRKLLSELPWIFMFDGLDEVPESSNRTEVLEYIRQFINFDLKEASADCFIINTTRPQGYNNEFDETHCCHLMVDELSNEECEEYIEKLFDVMEEKVDYRQAYVRLMKEALNDSITNRLMKTPLQVTIIAIIVKSGGKPPHERYSLFRQYYETIINREKQKNVITTFNDNINWLEAVHLKIANKLQVESENDENPSAEIMVSDLKSVIHEYIDANKDDDYQQEENIEEKFLEIITNRICFLNENRDGYYSFSIRSMQEYFAGTYLVKAKGDEEIKKNIEKIAYKSYWRNVLLFALGYIELERGYLLCYIVDLCNKMNGGDNLTAETYTEDNICLFGSWLAVDIVVEDIFKGKDKNSFIRIIAELVTQIEHAQSSRISVISGVSCKKLLDYTVEKNIDNQNKIMKLADFVFLVGKNENNDVESYLERIWKSADSLVRDRIATEVISARNRYRTEFVNKMSEYLLDRINKEKFWGILNGTATERLVEIIDENCSFTIKRFLLLNILEGSILDTELIQKCIFGTPIDVDSMVLWWRREHEGKIVSVSHQITFKISVRKDEYAYGKKDAELLRDYSKKIGAVFVERYCEYYLDATYENYLQLYNTWNDEKEPLRTWHGKLVERRKNGALEEKDFIEREKNGDILVDNIRKGDVVKILLSDTEWNLIYSCTCAPDVFDELIADERVQNVHIEQMGNTGIKILAFVAGVQIEFGEHKFNAKSGIGNTIYKLVEELTKRNLTASHAEILCCSVVLSSGGTKFLIDNHKYEQLGNRINQLSFENMLNYRECTIFTSSEKIAIISKIMRNIIDSEDESDFISLIYFAGEVKGEIEQNLCLEIVSVAKNLQCKNPINQLTCLLLVALMGNAKDAIEAIDKVFILEMPEELIYKCMIYLAINLPSANKKYIMVEAYKRVSKTSLANKEVYQRCILNSLMDI